jgi:hypothetical protein
LLKVRAAVNWARCRTNATLRRVMSQRPVEKIAATEAQGEISSKQDDAPFASAVLLPSSKRCILPTLRQVRRRCREIGYRGRWARAARAPGGRSVSESVVVR